MPKKRLGPLRPEERARASHMYASRSGEAATRRARDRQRPRPPAFTVEQMMRERDAALENGDLASMLHAEAGQTAIPTHAEQLALIARVQAGDKAAAATLVEGNLRLVSKIAHYYAIPAERYVSIDLTDLINEGAIGLLHAAMKFDASFGWAFSTYATWWVRQAITRALINQGPAIRVPVHAADTRFHANEVASEPLSLEREIPLRDGLPNEVGSLSEVIFDPDAEAQIEAAEERADAAHIASDPQSVQAIMAAIIARKRAYVRLGRDVEREMQIVWRRSVYEGKQPTLESIAQELGITRERVRQLEQAGRRLLQREYLRVHPELRRKLAAEEAEARAQREGGAA